MNHWDWTGLVGARRWLVLVGAAPLAACGPADAQSTESEDIAQTRAAVVNCSTITANDSGPSAKQVLSVLKDGVLAATKQDAGSVFSLVGSIFELTGGPSVDDRITELNAKLFCLAQALDWKMVELDYNTNQFAPVSAAWMEGQSLGFSRQSPYDVSSHIATIAAGGHVMFGRLYNPGDPATNGNWKNVISDNRPNVVNNQVFDWRMALPGFTRLVAARLAIIAMMDPSFRTNGLWNAELGDGTPGFPGYRGVLKARLDEMLAGVRCDFKDRLQAQIQIGGRLSHRYVRTEIGCADVNTGLSSITSFNRADGATCNSGAGSAAVLSCLSRLPSQASVSSDLDTMRRNLLLSMPVFELQSMIDTLTHFTRRMPDLTEVRERIPVDAAPGLCLDVPGSNSAPGTALQLYSCNATAAQQFSYDRANQTIRNPSLDKCVQVRPIPWGSPGLDNRWPGAVAETADCTSPPITRQKWTYDPEQQTIRSALGTVLDVQYGTFADHTPVWLWDYNNSDAQRWHADR